MQEKKCDVLTRFFFQVYVYGLYLLNNCCNIYQLDFSLFVASYFLDNILQKRPVCTTGVRSLRCLRSKIDSTTDLFSGKSAYKGQSWKKAEIFFIQNFIQNFIQDQFTANKMTEDSESNAEKGVVVINGNGNSSTANTTATAAAEKPDTTTETQKQQLQPTGGRTKNNLNLKSCWL